MKTNKKESDPRNTLGDAIQKRKETGKFLKEKGLVDDRMVCDK